VREAKKVEGFRFPLGSSMPVVGCKATEFQQARLCRVQRQAESRQPLTQCDQTALAVIVMLKAQLRTVREFTVRLLIPRRFGKSTSLYRFAFRDELAMPVDPTTAEQLHAYFRRRQQSPGHFTEPTDEDLEKAFRRFGAARFKALYRWWLLRGDPAIWAAQSPVLRDAIARGEGRLECVEISRQYLQLTSLVGVA
jgi:hypothetical protein